MTFFKSRPSLDPIGTSDMCLRTDIKYMGYKIKTSKFAYVAWFEFDHETQQPINTEKPVARQLYDLLKDKAENTNVIYEEAYKNEAKSFHAKLLENIIRS